MYKRIVIILLALLSFLILFSCTNSMDEKDLIKTLKEQEKLYSSIEDDYNTVEIDKEPPLIPQEYNIDTENIYNETYSSTESDAESTEIIYDEIVEMDEFNYNIYRNIINDINEIIDTNSSRISVLNNLAGYETGKFEILYTLHNVMTELSYGRRKAFFDRVNKDKIFLTFFEKAPEYAESTLIADIFQHLSFLKEGLYEITE